MLRAIVLLSFLTGCGGVVPDSPQACALQELARVKLELVRNWPIATVDLDGRPVRLVVDTGAQVTVLTEEAVRRLDIQTDWNRPSSLVGVGGALRIFHAKAGKIALAGATAEDIEFAITPATFSYPGVAPIDGFLGGDVLSKFDVDIDLPNSRMTLYRARPCPSGTPPWTEPFTALTTPSVWGPLINRPYLPITLDGHTIEVMLDTGAQSSTMTAAIAYSVGVTAEALAADRSGTTKGVVNGPKAVQAHRFSTLTVGPETFHNPTLVVTERMDAGAAMLLGSDYLRTHRAWISYASRKLFLGRLVRS